MLSDFDIDLIHILIESPNNKHIHNFTRKNLLRHYYQQVFERDPSCLQKPSFSFQNKPIVYEYFAEMCCIVKIEELCQFG